MKTPSPSFPFHTLTYAVAMAFSAHAGALEISQVPLIAGSSVPANLMYIHDDSGSMETGYLPDSIGPLHNIYTVRQTGVNKQYYSPGASYKAPPFTDNAHLDPNGANSNFNSAWANGYNENRNDPGNYTDSRGCTGNNILPRKVDLRSEFRPTKVEVGNQGCAEVYWYPPLDPPSGIPPGVGHYLAEVGGARHNMTTEAEKQNFANWYSYYRTRKMAAQAGIALAFNKLEDLGENSIRVGWGTINHNLVNSSGNYAKPTEWVDAIKDGKQVRSIIQGVRPFTGRDDPDQRYGGGYRREFFQWLYGLPTTSAGTPLRIALDSAGQYYDRSDDGSSLGPWAKDPEHPGTLAEEPEAACRKSFTILMTDGYYGDPDSYFTTQASTYGITAPGNADGGDTFTTPEKPDGTQATWQKQPYSDDYTPTLADIAWHYWANDLLPGHSNNKVVPNSPRDPAWWQHMTTYTVGLGVTGTVSKTSAFTAADDTTTSAPGTSINWTDVISSGPSDPERIDDLLHAAVNGHGDFFAASNPDEFVNAMEAVIKSIANSAGGSGNLARNKGLAGSSDALMFNTTYDANWNGDLTASAVLAISTSNLDAEGAEVWKASEQMPTADAREIFTRSNALDALASNGVTFTWDGVSGWQRTLLQDGDSDPDHGKDIIDYLRGSDALESNHGGPFRKRTHVSGQAALGDSVNTTPIYDKDTETLYQGANDGMLHAFSATTGVERFAYVPTGVFHKLPRLADPAYGHQFYVDGDVEITGLGSERYLVGVLGRGGKGAYGLKVTTPESFGTGDVKWEFNGRIDRIDATECTGNVDDDWDDMGFVIGKPVIARTSATEAVAIVSNGYNSCRNKAALYLIDVKTGAVRQKIVAAPEGADDNGLSAPFWLDADRDGYLSTPDTIYAGDLKGNLWRFEYDSGASEWKASYGGAAQPMFTAGAGQSITSAPLAIIHPDSNDIYVVVGTGQFLQSDDKEDFTVQSWYGLIDKNDGPSPITRGELKTRSLTFDGETGILSDGTTVDVRFVDQAVEGDMVGQKGWHIDFNLVSDKGERIVTPATAFSAGVGASKMVLMVSSLVPSDDKCTGGGRGHLNIINAFTGGELEFPIVDVNHDGKVGSEDRYDGRVPASLGFNGIPGPTPPLDDPCKDKVLALGTTTGAVHATKLVCPGSSGVKGRLSWREIVE